MPRLFGTDGIRGIANVDLKPSLALDLGRATAALLLNGDRRILVGQDTRRSCDMLVAAIVAGGTSFGAHVHRLGLCPTPALAFVTEAGGYGAGIMVSASHNPAEDNGLKVLDSRGMKLEDELEDQLEALIWRADELSSPTNDGLGREVDATPELDRYREHRLALALRSRSELDLVVDCANGSGSIVAADILAGTGAAVTSVFDQPDGTNINVSCGATDPEALAAIVRDSGADVGFALDGDADRCVAVDERGQIVDGDRLIGLVALDRLARGELAASTVVLSVLSNGGLEKAIQAAGGRVVRTPVGDKYILGAMLVSGAGLGGEKSGHLIMPEHSTSSDGILTALEVLDIIARTGMPLSELASRIPLFPQQQRTIPARHREEWAADLPLAEAVREAEAELLGRGRILVRPSGTEPALRIMVEGDDAARVSELADQLSALAGERLN
ncbi:MAG: phosphoglucosamine mutase [Chloroflexota bacterium]|jgi:phosphoglucosamine mutase|nr:phosphoglucosamine mutase [Chloroflexota bacterium]